eukprot:758913-Hanusia_phi.AAC.5
MKSEILDKRLNMKNYNKQVCKHRSATVRSGPSNLSSKKKTSLTWFDAACTSSKSFKINVRSRNLPHANLHRHAFDSKQCRRRGMSVEEGEGVLRASKPGHSAMSRRGGQANLFQSLGRAIAFEGAAADKMRTDVRERFLDIHLISNACGELDSTSTPTLLKGQGKGKGSRHQSGGGNNDRYTDVRVAPAKASRFAIPGTFNPFDFFVASLSACLLLVFLATRAGSECFQAFSMAADHLAVIRRGETGTAESLVSVPPRVAYLPNGAFPLPTTDNAAAGYPRVVYQTNGQFPEPHTNPAQGIVPLPYQKNGQFPEGVKPNPADGLRPLTYRNNGQFPEAVPANPAEGLIPLHYHANGQAAWSSKRCSSCRVHEQWTGAMRVAWQLRPHVWIRGKQFPDRPSESPVDGLIPLTYRDNGQFPESDDRNLAMGMNRVPYQENGQFPEISNSHEMQLEPVFYLNNGQVVTRALSRYLDGVLAQQFPVRRGSFPPRLRDLEQVGGAYVGQNLYVTSPLVPRGRAGNVVELPR